MKSTASFLLRYDDCNASHGKAEAFRVEQGRAESDLIDVRLAPDMLPFSYQIKACAAHSVGGIEGVRTGTFSPDMSPWPTDFASLHDVVQPAIASLEEIDRDAFHALANNDTQFAFGKTRLPFTGANFLLSFSQPNFYFHATTAYAILRAGREAGQTRLHGHTTYQALIPGPNYRKVTS
jgi:hypothetical protein